VLTDLTSELPDFKGTTLAELVAFSTTKNGITIFEAVMLHLAKHTATPILSVMDDHNALWNELGKDRADWDPFFRQFTRFPDGVSVMSFPSPSVL
jgi:hypothetical protein